MQALKVRVQNGRIKLDEPTDLPEGTVLNLVPADLESEFEDTERAALLQAIEEGAQDFERGEADDALEFSRGLMARS